MTEKEMIKKIEKLGFKEYKTTDLDNCDRCWHKSIKKDDDSQIFLTIQYYDDREYKGQELERMLSGWELVLHINGKLINGMALKCLIYSFKSDKIDMALALAKKMLKVFK